MSDNNITLVYGGVTITYVESANQWNFELRGRERNTDSLALAKEAIDKPDPPKKKNFQRIKAFVLRSANFGGKYRFQPVDVTSVAASPSWKHQPQFWIVDAAGKRSMEGSEQVYADTPKNREKMDAYIFLSDESTKLRAQAEADLKKIVTVEVPNE